MRVGGRVCVVTSRTFAAHVVVLLKQVDEGLRLLDVVERVEDLVEAWVSLLLVEERHELLRRQVRLLLRSPVTDGDRWTARDKEGSAMDKGGLAVDKEGSAMDKVRLLLRSPDNSHRMAMDKEELAMDKEGLAMDRAMDKKGLATDKEGLAMDKVRLLLRSPVTNGDRRTAIDKEGLAMDKGGLAIDKEGYGQGTASSLLPLEGRVDY